MNSTGKELSQADLIRNFILMVLEPKLQTRLYQDYWRPIELEFGQQAYGEQFDDFMRHFLTLKTGEIPKIDEVYESFKTLARGGDGRKVEVETLVREIREYSRYFCAMALGAEQNAGLRDAFQDLKELKVEVAYPFLLELCDDYATGILSREDFLGIVRLVEAYVFRRAICSIPTNSLNKTFSAFGKSLKKDRYLESVKAHFLTLPSYRRFPKAVVYGWNFLKKTWNQQLQIYDFTYNLNYTFSHNNGYFELSGYNYNNPNNSAIVRLMATGFGIEKYEEGLWQDIQMNQTPTIPPLKKITNGYDAVVNNVTVDANDHREFIGWNTITASNVLTQGTSQSIFVARNEVI